MTLRRADARFLLPEPPRSARVVGDVAGWRSALEAAGVELLDGWGAPDVVVGSSASVAEAIATGARSVILEGPSRSRDLRRHGYVPTRWIPVPRVEAPEILLPLDHPPAARYALSRWMVPDSRVKKARNAGLSAALAAGVWPSFRPMVTVASRTPGLPYLLEAAAGLGVRARHLFATLGGADDLSRGVLYAFPEESRWPRWAVKFSRVCDYSSPFDRDERGLRLAARTGGVVARHAPRFVGRLEVAGMHASVETAAVGERLVNFLKAPGTRGDKLSVVDRIASWIVEMARETAGGPDDLAAERARLRDEVLPAWGDLDVPPDLVERVESVGSVFRRGDLGCWNLVVDRDGFTAVDWEDAEPHGFPLWDLVYFLTDALALVDGAGDARDSYVRRLLRGDERSSGFLLRWVARAVASSPITPESVGAVITLFWLSVGRAHAARRDALERNAPSGGIVVPPAERVAAIWMADPGLGPDWDLWRRAQVD